MGRRTSTSSGDNGEKSKAFETALFAFRVVFMAAMLALGFNYVVSDIIKYYKRDTMTSVTVDLLKSVDFPAVTVCNYNRWKKSLVQPSEVSSLQEQLQSEAAVMVDWIIPENPDPDISLTTADNGETQAATMWLTTDAQLPTTLSSSLETMPPSQDALRLSSTLNATEIKNATSTSFFSMYDFTRDRGWKLTELSSNNGTISNNVTFNGTRNGTHSSTLLSCSFRGTTCDTSFFSPILTAYGNCYTFNKNINWSTTPSSARRLLAPKLTQRVASEDAGLSLSVNVEAWDYYENLDINGNMQVGLKVIVHSPNRLPDPTKEGISVSPGQHVTIPVTWNQFQYMEPPYGSCNSTRTLQYFDTYTQEGCMWECYRTKVESLCKCIIYYQANESRSVCDLNQSKRCAYGLIAEIGIDPEKYCDCPVACVQNDYASRAFYASAPGPSMAPDLAALYSMNTSFYRDNVVSLDVFISELTKTTTTQIPAMSIEQVIADAGGQLGLFAGLSVISFLELLEFAVDKFSERRSKKANEKKSSNNLVHPEKESSATITC